MYFVSNRTQPSYPFGLQNANIYRIPLTRQEGEFKSDKLAKVFEAEKKTMKKREIRQMKALQLK